MLFDNPYQDIVINGKVIQKGSRSCETRYNTLLSFMERYKDQDISILDFGANNGYFSFKLAKDYPKCKVTMVDYLPALKDLTEQNNMENVELIFKYFTEEELKRFGEIKKYDLVLLMSVLHHFEHPKEMIDLFLTIGKTVIFEVGYAEEQPVSNPEKIAPIYNYLQTKDPIQINSWATHDRPLYYVNPNEEKIMGKVHNGCGKACEIIQYIGSQLQDLFQLNFYPGTLNIKLDKNVTFINPKIIQISNVKYRIYPMFLNGFPVYNIRPGEVQYPTNEIEVISPYHLRSLFNLEDGNIVNISFNKKYIED